MAGVFALITLQEELDNILDNVIYHLHHLVELAQDEMPEEARLIELTGLLKQVWGTVLMADLMGAKELLDEVLLLTGTLKEWSKTAEEKCELLEIIGKNMLLLRRYFDFIIRQRKDDARLLSTAINNLRQRRGAISLSENHFFNLSLPMATLVLPQGDGSSSNRAEQDGTQKRLRQLYQTGLLATLAGGDAGQGLRVMARALAHLETLHATDVLGNFYRVAVLFLEALPVIGLTPERKTLLRQIDMVSRRGYSPTVNTLIQNILFHVLGSGYRDAEIDDFCQRYQLQSLPYSEQTLRQARAALVGPDSETYAALGRVVVEDITEIKTLLSAFEFGGEVSDGTIATLQQRLTRLGHVLEMAGLQATAGHLHYQAIVVGNRRDDLVLVNSVSELLLKVEAKVLTLAEQGLLLDESQSRQGDQNDAKNYYVNSALAVVWQALQDRLKACCQDFRVYVESGYDRQHIVSVLTKLEGMAGQLQFLEEQRLAKIVAGYIQLLQRRIYQTTQAPDMDEMNVMVNIQCSLEFCVESAASGLADEMNTRCLELAESYLFPLEYTSAVA